MAILEGIPVELSVVVGSTDIPIRQLLKMSRGAMIPLDCGHNDPSQLYVGNDLVAEGRLLIDGEQMALEITRVIERLS
jgi:flagellar motor switch protein FliN/FliY